MTRKSHGHDEPERAHEIKEELHHLDEVEASIHAKPYYEPAPYVQSSPPSQDPGTLALEGAVEPLDAPIPADVVDLPHEDLNTLMAGWWKEVRQLTLLPAQTGDHFAAYAAARGWQITEAPATKSPHEAAR